MKNLRILLLTLSCLGIALSLGGLMAKAQSLSQVVNANSTETELIARLNEWRLEEGLGPLQLSTTLNDLARFQVDFLMTQQMLNVETIHVGSSGELPGVRAQNNPYNWPNYGTRDRINIAEIAAVGTVNTALSFWRSSAIHRRSVTNPSYREVGIASAKRQNGTLFIVVFGSRPNVLPALVDPLEQRIYLSTEQYTWAQRGTSIVQAQTIQIFDALGRPVNVAPLAWQPVISLPEGQDRLYILTSDGSINVMSEINPAEDVIIRSAFLPQLNGAPSPTATPVPTSTPTLTPLPTATVRPPGTFLVTNTPFGAVAVSPTASPEMPTSRLSESPNLRIVYDDQSLSIINISGSLLNVSALSLRSEALNLAISRWGRVNTSLDLSRLPSGYCLQVWPWTVNNAPRPEACRLVSAVINVDPAQAFWESSAFEILWQGEPVAQCEADAGICEAVLPKG